jgi:membrane protein
MATPESRQAGRLNRLQEQVQTLINADAVAEAESRLGWSQRFAHFWILVGQMFLRNRGPVRAASLAYTTLLALVPLLAISLSVATLFLPRKEGERRATLVAWIEEGVIRAAPTLGLSGEGGQAQRAEVADRIVSFVERIHLGGITATAAAGLIVVAIGLLRTIEVAFNDIWGIPKGRSLLMSIVFYWAVITLGPAVLLVTKGAKVLSIVAEHSSALQSHLVGQWILSLTIFISPALMALAFGALYLWMPNTRVQWRAALVGGAFASALWTLNNQLSSLYHSKVLTYNAIYGSLGALPIFLFGVYFTWMIVLLGAQVSYVYQNRKAYLQERVAGRVHQQAREFAGLRLMTRIAREFTEGHPPSNTTRLSEELGIPPNLTKELLRLLNQSNLLIETRGTEASYLPSRPLARISVRDVLQALRCGSGSDLATTPDQERGVVIQILQEIGSAAAAKSGSVTLEDLSRLTPASPVCLNP